MEMQGQIQFLAVLPLQLVEVPEREQPQPAGNYPAEAEAVLLTQLLLLVLALLGKATMVALVFTMVLLRISLAAAAVRAQRAVPVLALLLGVLAEMDCKVQLAGLTHITLVAAVVAQVIQGFL
jgi:hypothetical protein